MSSLLLVTDAWSPQTNGVVTTLESVLSHLPALGVEATVVHPGQFRTVPLPSYPEIRLARNPGRLQQVYGQLRPDRVHVATEGPLGIAARRLLVREGRPFSTSLHTKFPEYLNERVRVPLSLGYRYIRWFHAPAAATLCTTESHRRELAGWGLDNLVVWGRGVDTERFRPPARRASGSRPRLLYVGRVAVEKNLEAFLSLSIDADKVVVGDGPAREALMRRFPGARWLGMLTGDPLVREYGAADAFVFPSRTDTFGLVMLEAMSCGTPVAAYPVTGPRDVVLAGINGALSEDLGTAIDSALRVDRATCRQFAMEHGWRRIAERFVASVPGAPDVAPPDRGPDNAASWPQLIR